MIENSPVYKLVKAYEPWLIEIRRHLHRNPELSGKEWNTQKYIIHQLEEMGIPCQPMAQTGVVATIFGALEGKTVALRADIDALPMEDCKGAIYSSVNPKVCHACGHDVHTTIALGVARYFSERKAMLKGNVKLLFQPAEETIGGAKRMVEEGCMQSPHVDYVIGKHVMPYLEVGDIEYRFGKMNAASDSIKITIIGKSSHGAYPEKGTDALLVASAVIQAVHTVVSRNVSPLESAVITLGMIEGGTKASTLCGEVVIKGTMRSTNEDLRNEMKERLNMIVSMTAAAFGAEGRIVFEKGYEALINNNQCVSLIKEVAEGLLDQRNLHQKEHPSMGVEDFSFFLNEAKGAFYHLGCGNKEKGIGAPLHSSTFDVDEGCMAIGVTLDVKIIEGLLLYN